MFSLFSSTGLSPSDTARLRRIEQKLDLILENLGVEFSGTAASGLTDEVRQLADDGQKIAAIKAYREQTGASLLDAKNAVEGYQDSRS